MLNSPTVAVYCKADFDNFVIVVLIMYYDITEREEDIFETGIVLLSLSNIVIVYVIKANYHEFTNITKLPKFTLQYIVFLLGPT